MRLAANGVWPRHAQLRQMQAAPLDAVNAAQQESLTRLVRHAATKVPYYRRVMTDAGVYANGRVDLAAFPQLPLLDKATLRTRFSELVASDADARKPYVNSTGGSTGEPVRFMQDRVSDQWKTAAKLLFDEWTGYVQGEPFALLWGAAHELSDASLKTRVGTYLRNELRLNAYLMSPTVMDSYIEKLNAFRPTLILAYAQSIYQLADHAERAGKAVWSPRAVMTSATNLDADMRATIGRVFAAPVFDRYGSREVGDVACENGDGQGLVVSPVTHYLEVIGPDGTPAPPGEPGELVVTLLTNYTMPLIRYRIGDAGTLGPPAGAVAWPRLTQVLGRVTDIFYTASGEHVYGGYFTRLFYGKEWLAQFQVVQEAYDHVVVRIVPSADTASTTVRAESDQLVLAVRSVMGNDCRVEVEIVDSIEVGPTGKRRYTISKVGPPP